MFRLGTDEALAEGYRRGLAAGLALAGGSAPRWSIVIPFKGGVGAKSRFASAFGADRQRIALAFLRDTVAAVADVDAVDRVILVSAEPLLHEALLPFEVEVVADPGGGLNAAVAAGVTHAQNLAPESFAAVLVGDLPALKGADLAAALDLAVEAARGGHPLGFVADKDGTGTTAVTAAPGATASTRFGLGSRESHAAAGFVELAVPGASSLHLDIDDAPTLDGVLDLVGPLTRAELARIAERGER
jgi:2-phospho-L-lactate guanylyltransferase